MPEPEFSDWSALMAQFGTAVSEERIAQGADALLADSSVVAAFLAYEEYGHLPRPEPTPKFLP